MAAPQPAANRVPAGKLKAAATGVGRPGAGGDMHVLRYIGNVVHTQIDGKIQLRAEINRPIIRRFGALLLKKAQADPSKNGVAVPPAAQAALKPVNKKVPVKAAAPRCYSQVECWGW